MGKLHGPALSLVTLRALARDLEPRLTDAQLSTAAAAHAKLRPGLLRLREIKFDYVGDVIEPACATRWVEQSPRRHLGGDRQSSDLT